ncbi:MAG: ArdC-like ssDNA-binding domain-containing protein [Planctomycetota bacterium]
MKREEVQELVERGITELNEALAGGRSDRLQEYLDVMARFPNYSFNNTILICLQKPEATLIQGFHAWRKMGRTVKKGEKGIGIFAPLIYKSKKEEGKRSQQSTDDEKKGSELRGFKVVHVFDVSQTEGEELPEFASVSGDPGNSIAAVESIIRDAGIELLYEMIPGGALGVSRKGSIALRPDLDPARRLMTLVHEYAHECLHDSERRKSTTKTVRETEAEAVAHVVARALGLDSLEQSSDYIQLYRGDKEVLMKSLDAIQKTASAILDGIRKHSANEDSAPRVSTDCRKVVAT